MKKRKRRRKPLGHAALTARQALTKAEIAAGNGECNKAVAFFWDADRHATAHERKAIGQKRFDQISRLVNRCTPHRRG